jgi:hypothetical protein
MPLKGLSKELVALVSAFTAVLVESARRGVRVREGRLRSSVREVCARDAISRVVVLVVAMDGGEEFEVGLFGKLGRFS